MAHTVNLHSVMIRVCVKGPLCFQGSVHKTPVLLRHLGVLFWRHSVRLYSVGNRDPSCPGGGQSKTDLRRNAIPAQQKDYTQGSQITQVSTKKTLQPASLPLYDTHDCSLTSFHTVTYCQGQADKRNSCICGVVASRYNQVVLCVQ